jgi:outer membrane protein assembly factor BamB
MEGKESVDYQGTIMSRQSFLRCWLPWLLVTLGGLSILGVRLWPDPDFAVANRNLVTTAIALLILLLLFVWGLVFSPYRRWVLLGGVVLVITAAACMRSIEFYGDMALLITYRWEPDPNDLLEAHRKYQPIRVQGPVDSGASSAADYPEYRGRDRDGIARGPPLARDWTAHPPRLAWRQPVGGGYASFAVAGSAAVTIEQRRQEEVVVCYDAATGAERWVHSYPAYFTETMGGKGPRATPTIAEGTVYALGATGMLTCLELGTGQLKWSVNILEDNDNVRWGMSGSPLVYDQVVVVNPGVQRSSAEGRALVAYDRTTGKPVWSGGKAMAGYSSPMLATVGGRRQIVLLDGEGVAGYDPEHGTELWRFDWNTMNGINVAQPLVLDGDRVFITAAYGMGCVMLHVTESGGIWTPKPLWRNKNLRCKFSSPVIYKGHLYGLDDGGILACVDENSGEQKWRKGRYDEGQLLLADDLLLVLSEGGQLALVEARPDQYHELARSDALKGKKTWNCPALAGGKAYVRNAEEMACYDLAAREGEQRP